MTSRYPIVLAHGLMLRDIQFFKAFGRIEKILKTEGFVVYTADTDGVGTIENNAAQLAAFVEDILKKEGVDKVNIIAHSKGGLDTRYMIDRLGMGDKVASVTFLCTPHKGSQIATKLYKLPKWIKGFIAFWINVWYRIFGDKKPDVLEVCRQLQTAPDGVLEDADNSDGIFMQSFSSTLKRSRDDFVMGIPLKFSRKYEKGESDGMVSVESSKFAEYRGNCTDGSVSHTEIVDFMVRRKKKEKIYAFYVGICEELANRGF
ncbi:MAG: hypothetical protein IJX87_06460 [Clostridia bacterium]|nr:hypothetical protein [Clostridia bacterium]